MGYITITKKIWLSNTVLILGFLATLWVGFVLGMKNESQLQAAGQTVFPAAMKSAHALNAFREQMRFYQDAVLMGETELLQAAQNKAEVCQDVLREIEALRDLLPLQRERISELVKRHRDFTKQAAGVYSLLSTEGDNLALQPQVEEDVRFLSEMSTQVEADLQVSVDRFSDLLTQKFERLSQSSYRQRYGNLWVFVTVLTVAVGLMTLMLNRYVTGPIKKTVDVIQVVANGDLTHALDSQGGDEISLLGGHFNTMVDHLKRVLGKIQDVASEIQGSGKAVLVSSESQSASVANQSSAITQVTAASGELASTSEHMGANINAISQKADHVSQGMMHIKESTDNTNHLLVSLNEKSKQIGHIIEIIDDVAEQTNLLAVNASIEAARAGEHGRGFAVVADQITKLADSTTRSTRDITSLIELIQHEMSGAILAMSDSLERVEQEIQLAQQAAIESKEVAAGVTEQISNSKVIAEAMKAIDQAMRKISDDARESSTAAGQLNQLARSLEDTVGEFVISRAS